MVDWRPGATREMLAARAGLLADIRAFFARRDVLEVATPQLASAGVTDPAIEPLIVSAGQSLAAPRFLQTSPEYAMKRLLAAGSGPIYEIARVFRDGEYGARHNPEFTLLEWYRPGLDHHALMTEVAELVSACLGAAEARRMSYRELFLTELAVDPFLASVDTLSDLAREAVDTGGLQGDRDLWLDLLMSHVLEPRLAGQGRVFIHDYPASQAALSRIVEVGGVAVGQRFELYVDGVELANGYFELIDADEQGRRFEQDNATRRARGMEERPLDEKLLAALEAGLPACSGVALGVDRLLMLRTGCDDLRQLLAFDWERS